MKHYKGYWFYQGRTYTTLHAALLAARAGKASPMIPKIREAIKYESENKGRI